MTYDLEDLGNRFSIETLATEYGVDLEPHNQDFVALCPFHDDHKSKSLRLYTDTNTWWCYGCQCGGTIFDFLMYAENISFAEAVDKLAERAGLKASFRLEDVNIHTTDFFIRFRHRREQIEERITKELRDLYFNGLAFKQNTLYFTRINDIWRWYDKSQRFFDGYLIKFKQLAYDDQMSSKDIIFNYLIQKLQSFYVKYVEKVENIKEKI